MENKIIKCPSCGAELKFLRNKIEKRDGVNYMIYLCPQCSHAIKEKVVKYSQSMRLVFIVVGIPLLILLGLGFLMAVNETVTTDSFFILLLPPLFLMFAVYYLFQKFFSKDSNPNQVLEKDDIGSYQENETIAQIKNEDVILQESGDPTMNKIRSDIVPGEKETSEPAYKNAMMAKKVLKAVFIVIIIFSAGLKVVGMFGEFNASNTKLKSQILDARVDMIYVDLERYYMEHGAYPQDLKPVTIFQFNISDVEKDTFGKKIELSDFKYQSDKKSYKLCFETTSFSKCYYSPSHQDIE